MQTNTKKIPQNTIIILRDTKNIPEIQNKHNKILKKCKNILRKY